jgi:hypothetical protein
MANESGGPWFLVGPNPGLESHLFAELIEISVAKDGRFSSNR